MNVESLNCNGLGHESKVCFINNTIINNCLDVLFLQETHIDTLKLATYLEEQKLVASGFWSFGSSSSRGVAILFKDRKEITCTIFLLIHQVGF